MDIFPGHFFMNKEAAEKSKTNHILQLPIRLRIINASPRKPHLQLLSFNLSNAQVFVLMAPLKL